MLPDYGKISLSDSEGIPLPQLFPDATAAALEVLAALLSYASETCIYRVLTSCLLHTAWEKAPILRQSGATVLHGTTVAALTFYTE